jgi:hypothetical protein
LNFLKINFEYFVSDLAEMAYSRAADSFTCSEEDSNIYNVMELLNKYEEDLTEVNEAANLQISVYDHFSADLFYSPIILPAHLR